MSQSAREHLLGYLLGALEDQEQAEVEEALEHSPQLREQLERLRHRVQPLACDRDHHLPPAGLAKRTCSWLATQMEPALCQAETTGATPGPTRAAQPLARRGLRERRETGAWYSWSVADTVVTAGIAMVAAMLFFPAITHSRHRSQILSCQQNMHRVGIGLQSFAATHNGLFPQESLDGDRAFAGVFGPDLVEGTYLTDAQALLCPAAPSKHARRSFRVPRLWEIARAKGEDRRRMQRDAAGDFAYCLGYKINGVFSGPRDNRRATFALLSDVPCLESADFRAANHAGLGQNVLFEDGHVEHLKQCNPLIGGDYLFVNQDGAMKAGLTPRDCVLAPGFVSP